MDVMRGGDFSVCAIACKWIARVPSTVPVETWRERPVIRSAHGVVDHLTREQCA